MRVACPVCLGRFTLESRYHQDHSTCYLCGDNKQIDTDLVCECGRPATRIVNKTMICTFVMCEKRAMEKKDAKPDIKVETLQDNFNDMYLG